MFIQGLWDDLAKKVMVEDHTFATYSEALNRALRVEIMLDKM